MTFALASAFERVGWAPIREWYSENSGLIIGSFVLAVVGVLCVVQPAAMLQLFVREYPELAEDKRMLVVSRVIGAGLAILGLFILSKS